MVPTSSAPSRLHHLVDTDFPPSDLEDESEENEESGSRRSNDATDYESPPDEDEPESNFSPATERSQLEISYSYNADGRRSSIKEIKFYDARDVKSNTQWKVVLPFDKNQCHRVAAAMSIMCKETTDTNGSPLPSDLASRICELLLGDLDKEKALNSMSVLYTTYRTDDKANRYLPFARCELRRWYDKRAKETVGNEGNPKNIKIPFQSGQLKRALEAERDTEHPPPAKRSLRTISPKAAATTQAIQMQSSPGTSHLIMHPGGSSKGPARRSSSDTATCSVVRQHSIPITPTVETHAPMKALGKPPTGLC